MKLFNRTKPYKILDGFRTLSDGYTENPLAHHLTATDMEKESEYFMQWVHPIKLNRVALRTPAGFRFIYLYAKDLWNNRLGIEIPDDEDRSDEVNKQLLEYLISIRWFREMEKLSAYEREQGEAILLCYYDDEGGVDKYFDPVTDNQDILKVEAFNWLNYTIPEFDKCGEPLYYNIEVKAPGTWRGLQSVKVHPSRVLRKTAHNLEYRYTGYSDLAAIYDPIVILSSILKSAGEAAFRWGTGHPVFFTKDIFDETDLAKLKDNLGDVTRKNWHAIPSEKVEKIEMLGQAGSMLNLKSLADIAIDNIVIGSAFPKSVLLGEVAGVMGSEVTERSYFSLMDRDHTDLDWFVRKFFRKAVQVRRIMKGVDFYNLNWGIREVFNKMDEADYSQKLASVAIAMQAFATINESRKVYGLDPLPDEEGGVIMGLLPYYEFLLNASMMGATMEGMENETHGEAEAATSMKEKSNSTNKQAASIKEPEKNKRVAPPTRDAIIRNLKDNMLKLRDITSVGFLNKEWSTYDKTTYKILKWAEEK